MDKLPRGSISCTSALVEARARYTGITPADDNTLFIDLLRGDGRCWKSASTENRYGAVGQSVPKLFAFDQLFAQCRDVLFTLG